MQIVLELVEVEAEVAPQRLRASSSRHRRLPDSRHEEGAQQAAARTEQQGEDCGTQDVVGARAPEALIGLAENRDQLIAGNLVQLRVVAFEHVETHRLFTK